MKFIVIVDHDRMYHVCREWSFGEMLPEHRDMSYSGDLTCYQSSERFSKFECAAEYRDKMNKKYGN